MAVLLDRADQPSYSALMVRRRETRTASKSPRHSRRTRSDRAASLSKETDQHLRASLEAAGCRYTSQRAAVYEYLASVETHPTAEEICQHVRHRLPRISLATVYKALEALVEAQLATKLTNGDDSARYDCRCDDHYHLRDVATGEIRDLSAEFDPELLTKLDPRLQQRLARQGFRMTGYRLEVLGHFE